MSTGPQPFGEFYARVGEKTVYGIDWEPWLENRWRRGAIVALNAVVRPSTPNGLEFVCVSAGKSAAVEPLWPAAGTIQDGSVTWTSQPASTQGLMSTVSSIVWTPPSGVTATNQSLVGQVASALIDFTSAAVGTDYSVSCQATMANGQIEPGVLVFRVR